MKATTKLDSPIFSGTLRRQAVSGFVSRQAKDFKNLTKKRMEDSKPSGRLYRRKRGQGFTRSHRASARGQRPAIDSGKLLNSVNDRRISEFRSVAEVDAKYAEYLQSATLDRPIMSKRDAGEAQLKAIRDGEATIVRIL